MEIHLGRIVVLEATLLTVTYSDKENTEKSKSKHIRLDCECSEAPRHRLYVPYIPLHLTSLPNLPKHIYSFAHQYYSIADALNNFLIIGW
jgi:hypothetical protein